ncbi:uncharacterized protein LOC111328223 isoform X2 [Stylophora pistillata]|uniref:uncharacterized protein LOC111328223 isoform X2 n=1 Tax=Stylophora pistillata TaxID=50429 RepID=UPI000C03DB90|nr:uncharacterized protein LOC111328223 isoform X2 [Stylophora pistillata]
MMLNYSHLNSSPKVDGSVAVYDTEGNFVRRIGQRILENPSDITISNDGLIFVSTDSCVHIFGDQGDHLNKFKLQSNGCDYLRIRFHPGGEHVVIAGRERGKDLLRVEIYTKDGRLPTTRICATLFKLIVMIQYQRRTPRQRYKCNNDKFITITAVKKPC